MYQMRKKHKINRIRENFYHNVFDNINSNSKKYALGIGLLLFGMIVGSVYVKNLDEGFFQNLKNQIIEFINNIINIKEANQVNLIKEEIIRNIIFCFFLCVSGTTIIGLPIIVGILIYKGFCIGYTISLVVSVLGFLKGTLFIFSSMFLQNLIYIPCLLYIFSESLKIYKIFFYEKRFNNLKNVIIKYLVIIVLIFLLFFVGILIERFISFNILALLKGYF